MDNQVKVWLKADNGKMSKVLEFPQRKIEIPINADGSVKWFEDKPKKLEVSRV